jgi:anti-anti-sigma factor
LELRDPGGWVQPQVPQSDSTPAWTALAALDPKEAPILRIERSGTETLCLFGDLDLAAYETVRAALAAFPGPVRLDVAGVTFMDSTGVRLILQRLQTGPVTLVFPASQIMRLLEHCGATEIDGLTLEYPTNSN